MKLAAVITDGMHTMRSLRGIEQLVASRKDVLAQQDRDRDRLSRFSG